MCGGWHRAKYNWRAAILGCRTVREGPLSEGGCTTQELREDAHKLESWTGAVQIVDRFHAKQHLSEAGKAIWGPDSPLGKTWGQERHAELDAGQLDAVLQALTVHASTCETARKDYEYFQRNRQRMRYPDFHARGLCTSSGVLEAGCKTAIGARLKRSGMHWTTRGANAIIALRCAKLSGRLDDFWERRAQPPAA